MGIYQTSAYSSEPGKMRVLKKIFDKYGSRIYRRVLNETQDRELAKAVTIHVFSDFYDRMRQQEGAADSFEMLLNELADTRMRAVRYSEEDMAEMLSILDSNTSDESECDDTCGEKPSVTSVQVSDPHVVSGRSEKKKKRLSGGAIAAIVIVCVAAAWVILGLAADTDSLPDLGYKWFNANVFNIF